MSWADYFRKVKPPADAVRETVLTLISQKKFKQVTDIIEAALLRGRSEPWMYDVLASSMQAAGRPKEDIERALLSRVDFTAVHVPSMLFSAAYLKRLGAEPEALKLYRQAARLAPVRPEPYVSGLRIAVNQKDWESVGWAAAGVLSYAWTKNYKDLHKQADGAAGDAYKALLKAGKKSEAEKLRARVQASKQRDLHVKLTWSGKGDLDLLVEEPGGSTCSYKEPQTNGGGFLLHDGAGPKQENCFEEYVCPVAHSGNYKLRVRHVFGDIVGKRATLEVTRFKGTKREQTSS